MSAYALTVITVSLKVLKISAFAEAVQQYYPNHSVALTVQNLNIRSSHALNLKKKKFLRENITVKVHKSCRSCVV